MAAEKEFNNNENGQAVFELIMFVPFLIYFLTLLFNSGSAINGSINQQKATRGYFHFIIKGNSYLPVAGDLARHAENGLISVSAASIGWAESRPSDGEQFGTCYKYSTLYSKSTETCEEKSQDESSSIFVKPLTFYGVCSATYVQRPDGSYQFDLANGSSQDCNLGGG